MVKTMAEMRHDVVENTIKLELMLDDIIKSAYGFDIRLQETINDFGEEDVVVENEKEIERFEKFFLEKTNLESKFTILKDIIENEKGVSVSTDTWKDAKRLREIRNIFAHSLAPKNSDGRLTLREVALSFPRMKKQNNWEMLYEEFITIFNKVYESIQKQFYIKVID